MADKRISELEQSSSIQDGCCFPIVTDSETKKISFGTIVAALKNMFAAKSDYTNHVSNAINPHKVTAAQVGAPTIDTFDALAGTVGNIKTELTLTAIPSGSDLDDYQSVGIWYSVSSAVSSTILNTPFTAGAFRLDVKQITSGRLMQVIYANIDTSRLYIRNLSGAGWSEWRRINGTNANASVYGAEIPSGANLDDYTTVGEYYVPSTEIASSLTGTPFDGSGITAHLDVKGLNNANNSRLIQIYTPNWGTSTQLGAYYIRQRISGGWSSWYKYGGEAVSQTSV